MPRKPQGRDKPRDSTSRSPTSFNACPQASRPSDLAMLATSAHVGQNGPQGHHMARPTLPPLSYLQAGSQFPPSPTSASTASYSGIGSHVAPSQYTGPNIPQPYSAAGRGGGNSSTLPIQGSEPDFHGHLSVTETGQFLPSPGQSYNPLKRPHETSDPVLERSHHGTLPYSVATGDMSEHRGYPYSGSASNLSTPTTTSYPNFVHNAAYPSTRSTSSTHASRFRLHIRQQPRAARAGPDGKDRRPIDPPPVLQLLMTDFNVDDEAEVEELQSRYWVAHCRLVSASSPRRDMSILASTTEDGSKEIQRLLLGTTVASPFSTKDDPDPETMPLHPTTADTEPSGPPSPSSRFFPSSRTNALPAPQPRTGAIANNPATFFIFADISVRKAGEYRLEFSLMHMDPESLSQAGYNVPILCTVASQVFKVVNAKDFDQVKASSVLVRGLVERGGRLPFEIEEGRTGRGTVWAEREGSQGEGEDSSDEDDD